MALVPCNFKLSQDDKFVYIQIEVHRYAKEEKAEYHIDGSNFIFYLKPYQVKLDFKKPLNEHGEMNMSVYNEEKGFFTCRMEKLNVGENFDELDSLQEETKQSEDPEEAEVDEVVREELLEAKLAKSKYDEAMTKCE